MSITKLAIYNEACRRMGSERLASDTEDREVRYKLDEIWDLGAVEYVVRLVKPICARKTVKLTTTTTVTTHGMEYEHTRPSDFAGVLNIFSDANLDEAVNRYILEEDKIYSEFSDIWLRYLYIEAAPFTYLTQDVVNVLAAYLAKQVAKRINPDDADRLVAEFDAEVQASLQLTLMEEPHSRPERSLTSIDVDWMPIYNDALQILGRTKLTSYNDDRWDRVLLDTARETKIVQDLISSYTWTFVKKMIKSTYNSHLEPVWGYDRVHEVPADSMEMDGLFTDEYGSNPLKDYRYEESRYIYCSYDDIWIQYTPNTLAEMPSSWPTYFARFVAGALANQVKTDERLQLNDGQMKLIMRTYDERKYEAENRDFKQSEPMRIKHGDWTRTRQSGWRGENGGRR